MKFKIELVDQDNKVQGSWEYKTQKAFKRWWTHYLRHLDFTDWALVGYQEGTPASPEWQEFRRRERDCDDLRGG